MIVQSIRLILITTTFGLARGLSSRLVAAKALLPEAIQKLSAFPLQRLESSSDYVSLDSRDRSFSRALVTTVERRMGQIDKVIDICREKSSRGGRRKGEALVDATLRLGVAQILFLEVPPHAAVKETIDILRSVPSIPISESKIKFANAILRRVSREGVDLLQQTNPSDNVAPWLLERWIEDWGMKKAMHISEAFMKQSPVHLTVKLEGDRESKVSCNRLQQIVDAFEGNATVLPNGSIKVGDDKGGLINKWPLYEEGTWWVQDVSASIPAVSLYNAFETNCITQMHVVDMCAAPGGKTAQLISYGFGKVTAVELSSKRIPRLKKNLSRLDILDKCELITSDGITWVPANNDTVNGVLLDVPCSATGTGSKRPDVMRRSHELKNLVKTQECLVNNCVENILRPGGVLVYSTCSILKEESEDQIQKLLLGFKVETIPFQKGEIPGFDECIDENGWMRILPGSLDETIGSCDGFFVARLRRIK
jgi:16S rRNA (cytosine967-C5)-methyltransferase